MPLLTAFLVLSAPSAASVFDASLAAHSHLMKGDVSVSIETKLGAQDVISRARLRFIEPDRLSLAVQEPEQNGQAASRRTYTLLGHRFVAVDDANGEYTERSFPFPEKLDLSDRLMATLGSPGDAVGTILSPREMAKFYSNFRQLPDLTVAPRGGLVLVRRSAAGAHVEFDFGSTDHLLRTVRLDNPQGFLLWTFSYGPPPSSIAAPRISGLRKVESLVVRSAPPKYQSAAAKALARKSEQAYSRMTSLRCLYGGPEGNGTFYVQGRAYRQDSGAVNWTYRDGTLQVVLAGTIYRGRRGLTKVPGTLSALNGSVQPMLLQIMESRNPMGTLLVTESTVRLAGEVKIEGASCGILEIKARGITVNVTVRESDGLILLTRSTILGPGGRVASREENVYRYDLVNKPMPNGGFTFGTGAARPLPPEPVVKPKINE